MRPVFIQLWEPTLHSFESGSHICALSPVFFFFPPFPFFDNHLFSVSQVSMAGQISFTILAVTSQGYITPLFTHRTFLPSLNIYLYANASLSVHPSTLSICVNICLFLPAISCLCNGVSHLVTEAALPAMRRELKCVGLPASLRLFCCHFSMLGRYSALEYSSVHLRKASLCAVKTQLSPPRPHYPGLIKWSFVKSSFENLENISCRDRDDCAASVPVLTFGDLIDRRCVSGL